MTSLPTRVADAFLRRRRPETRINAGYAAWRRAQTAPVDLPNDGPLISVIMPAWRTPPEFLLEAIASVSAQTYRNWQLCVAHDASANMAVLATQAALDRRIKIVRQTNTEGGISAATNDALRIADGDFVAFMDHDDRLAPFALARIAAEIAAFPDADMIFSDEDQFDDDGHSMPYFKPGWNPDLLLGQNAVCHLAVYHRDLMAKIGGFRTEFDGSQDYDVALRASAAARHIRHVPEILYHWRQTDISFSTRRPDLCTASAHAAVQDFVGDAARVELNPFYPQWLRVIFPLPDPLPTVSAIVPEGAAPPEDADYPFHEILHGDPAHMAGQATGEMLFFADAGLAASAPGWLGELVSHALRPGVGCAGARIDGQDGRIVNAGLNCPPGGMAQSLAPGADAADPGYRGHFVLARDVAAVTGAYVVQRSRLALSATMRQIWTPFARLTGPAPRPQPPMPDPFWNPNLRIKANNLFLSTP